MCPECIGSYHSYSFFVRLAPNERIDQELAVPTGRHGEASEVRGEELIWDEVLLG